MSKPLKQFIALAKGKPPSEADYTGENACVYLTPEYLRGRATPELVRPAPNAVFVKQGETIVLWDGSNAGEVFYAKEGALSSTMARIDHNNSFNDDYFYYSLKGWEAYLKGQTSGSGIPHVDREILEGLTIFNCDVPEQTKIAEILSTVDRTIEQTEALIKKQQRIKTGLMADLLTRGIDADGNLRSEATHAFKDSPLGRIPVEWEVKTVLETSTKVTDGDHHTPSRSESGYYLLSARNVNNGYLALDDVDYVPLEEYLRMRRRCDPEFGDILISCSGTVGRVCAVPVDFECVLVRSAALIKFNHDIVLSRFAEWIIGSPIVQTQILTAQRQAAQPNLFQGEIEKLNLLIPGGDEQRVIGNKLDELSRETKRLGASMAKLRSLKTALMQDLLTGKKRVTSLLEKETTA